MAMPPSPPSPPMAGGMPAQGTSPAAPQSPDRGGKEARGKIVAGLGLEMLRIAVPLLGNSPLGQRVSETVAKLGKEISKPPQDLGQSEMQFMSQQLFPGGPTGASGAQGGPMPGMAPGLPPAPPPPPVGGAAGAA